MKKRSIISVSFIILVIAGFIGLYSFSNSDYTAYYQQQRTAAMNYQNFCSGCHGANLEKFAARAWMEERRRGWNAWWARRATIARTWLFHQRIKRILR